MHAASSWPRDSLPLVLIFSYIIILTVLLEYIDLYYHSTTLLTSGIAVTSLVALCSYKLLIAYLLCRNYAQCFSMPIMPKIILA